MHLIHWENRVLATLVVLGLAVTAQADELVPRNGSVIVGKLVSSTSDNLVYDTPFAGRISSRQDSTVSITTDEPVTLKTYGAVYADGYISTTQDEVRVKTEGGTPVRIEPVIERINPKTGTFLPGHDQKLRAAIEQAAGGLLELRRIVEEGLGRPVTVANGSNKIRPECGHIFQGNGWDGIDAHWKAMHGQIMSYAEAWPLIKASIY